MFKGFNHLKPRSSKHFTCMIPWILKPIWGLLPHRRFPGCRIPPTTILSTSSYGALGLLSLAFTATMTLGCTIQEPAQPHKEMMDVLMVARRCVRTIRLPQVWRPSLYMFLAILLDFSVHEGQFYWYTDAKAGPAFSKDFVGITFGIAAIGSIMGVILYHRVLSRYTFRRVVVFAQLLPFTTGMLDLMFVLRLNLQLGLPDSIFIIFEEMSVRLVRRIGWMPTVILSTRLCPIGIEGTFFALLMCIDSFAHLLNQWVGGLVLNFLNISRTNFNYLWLALLVRNLLRVSTLGLIFLVPDVNQNDALLPREEDSDGSQEGEEEMRLLH